MQSVIDHGDALVDRRSRAGWLLAGLESDVLEQDGVGERIRRDCAGVMDAFPPAEKVKQDMCVTSNGEGGQAAETFQVEVTVCPLHLAAGGLFDDAEGAASGIDGGLLHDMESHCVALSSSAWNWRASPPAVEKLLGT